MSNYTFRKLGTDEFQLLIPMMKDCFGMDVNLQYFEWKFVKNPAGFVEGYIALAEDGEVAAYYGAIPEIYMINGEKITIYQSCDTMTHSKHRRKGLFQKLAQHCYEDLRAHNKLFVIGFGGGQSTPGFLKFGWKHIFDIKYYFYPKLFSYFNRARENKSIGEIHDYSQIEHLILKSNSYSPIHSLKTLDVFTWRLSNPQYQYQVIAYKSGLEYSSYICYYEVGDKIMLFDFYFQDSIGTKALAGYLKSILVHNNYKGIVSFCQEKSCYSKALKKLGFINNPFNKGPLSVKTPFIFFSTEDVMGRANNPIHWSINAFDHDSL